MDLEKDASQIIDTKYTIKSVLDAINIIAEGCDGHKRNFPPPTPALQDLYQGVDNENPYVNCRYKFPFGIWFRGHEKACYHLKPSLFRGKIIDGKICEEFNQEPNPFHKPISASYYDETSMFFHFQHRMPSYNLKNYTLFDWLCLMQHYELPTRLLDWTENILIALFFAVKDKKHDNHDGLIYALNSARLNEISSIVSRKRQVFDPSNLDVTIRCLFSISRTREEFISYLEKEGVYNEALKEIKYKEIVKWLSTNDKKILKELLNNEKSLKNIEKVSYPVAVYPNRNIERMALQLSVMTLYGGKSYDRPKGKNYYIGITDDIEKLPLFRSIFRLNNDILNSEATDYNNVPITKNFLKSFIIRKENKVQIREELKRIGFNDVSMFPEIQNQANYIKKQWRIDHKIDEY
jgi:hypothetical protein